MLPRRKTSRSGMSKYFCILSKTFQSNLVYRASIIWTMFFRSLSFLFQYFLWKSLIGSGVYKGITLNDMIFYTMLTTLVGSLSFSPVADELESQVRDGSVIMNFLRPISFKLNCLFSSFGDNLFFVATQVVPVYIIGAIAIGIPAPANALQGFYFAISVIMGFLISFEVRYVVGLLAFWLQKTWYLYWYLDFGLILFGGTLIPLWFFTDFWVKASYFLPFRYISYDAINIYLGKIADVNIAYSLSGSLAWLVILFLIENAVWKMAQKKLCVNGG